LTTLDALFEFLFNLPFDLRFQAELFRLKPAKKLSIRGLRDRMKQATRE
jgi:hypothetical protein